MAKAKNKTCIDCLYCKVSVNSTIRIRLCYCAKEGKETQYPEAFWLEKKVCGEFSNMGSRIRLLASRRPLLKKEAVFLGGLSRR
jgi:hypothetical protein